MLAPDFQLKAKSSQSSPAKIADCGYLRIFHYRLRTGPVRAFKKIYGPGGTWAAHFKNGPGYLGTQLLQSAESTAEYITIDCWKTEGHWLRFKAAFETDYQKMSRGFSRLYSVEKEIGSFKTSPVASEKSAISRPGKNRRAIKKIAAASTPKI